MDSSHVRDQLRRRAEEVLARPPLDTVRLFLATEFGDADSFDEVRARLGRLAQVNIRSHQRDLLAFEAVIADPPPQPGVLSHMVAFDAGWELDNHSDATALEFLRQVAQMLREVIGAAPATADRWQSWPPLP